MSQGAVIKKRFTRRQFLFGIGAAGFCVGGYTKFVEPTWLEIGRHEIKLSSRPDQSPLKILHLSDLHASDVVELDFIDEAISTGLSLKPDLIFVTGDFVTARHDRIDEYAQILSRLANAAPSFACLGNHDGGRWVSPRSGYRDTKKIRELIHQSQIELLDNKSKTLELQNWKVRVVGLGDMWANEFRPKAAFAKPAPDDAITLVLSHNPDSKDRLKDYRWHAVFCGHTHGGQLRLPLVGEPFAPVHDKRFIAGLYPWQNRWIHITKGIGNVHGLRFNCRPEVSLITLV